MPLLGYIKNNKKVKNAYYLDIIGTPITYQDFMQLTPTQQENGNWYVTGMPPMVNAYSIMYKNGLSVGQAVDELNSDITANDISGYTDIKSYTSNNMFTIPNDGYVQLSTKSNGIIVGRICSSDGTARLEVSVTSNTDSNNMLTDSVYVRRGMKYYTSGTAGVGVEVARYFPIV